MSGGTKHPKGQNVQKDKTSGGTKRPEGQKVWRDKTSRGTKRLAGKMSMWTKQSGDIKSAGQNFCGDKMSIWTILPETKHPSGSYF
jgi:hypothetical protein